MEIMRQYRILVVDDDRSVGRELADPLLADRMHDLEGRLRAIATTKGIALP